MTQQLLVEQAKIYKRWYTLDQLMTLFVQSKDDMDCKALQIAMNQHQGVYGEQLQLEL